MVMQNVPAIMIPSASSVITDAFRNASFGMAHRKAFPCLPVAADLIPCNNAKKVVVLIPPPVEPGEAPMNIRVIRISRPAVENSPKEYVENPAQIP